MKIASSFLTFALGAAAMTGVASAQGQPVVDVTLGPAVQARLHDLGVNELGQQQDYLRRQVLTAVSRRHDPPSAIHLVIADIEPNRPTSAQLGASTQLSEGSFGVGGAAITGVVVTSDGRSLPVRYRFFQDQLRNETNFSTWGDADQAFDDVAALLGHGSVPNDPHTWPPPHVARAMTGTRIPG